MIKRTYIFLLFLKFDENNIYLFSKNYYLFTLFLKIIFKYSFILKNIKKKTSK